MPKTKQKSIKRPSNLHKKGELNTRKHARVFIKTYIPIVFVVGFALFINNTLLANIHNVLGATTNISPDSLLVDTNIQRTNYGEKSLKMNSDLTKAAENKAENMVALNYWSHDTPSGQPPWVFITRAGYKYKSAGENLAYGFNSSSEILNAWMHSPEHRSNILDSKYQNVGFGIATSANYQGRGPQIVIVAMYGQPDVSTTDSNTSNLTAVVTKTPHVISINRAQLLIGNYSSLVDVIIVLTTALLGASIILRHGIKWKRAFTEGEDFILHHPIIDIATTGLIMFGFIFSVTAGYIG